MCFSVYRSLICLRAPGNGFLLGTDENNWLLWLRQFSIKHFQVVHFFLRRKHEHVAAPWAHEFIGAFGLGHFTQVRSGDGLFARHFKFAALRILAAEENHQAQFSFFVHGPILLLPLAR